jgi:hypothetical protein
MFAPVTRCSLSQSFWNLLLHPKTSVLRLTEGKEYLRCIPVQCRAARQGSPWWQVGNARPPDKAVDATQANLWCPDEEEGNTTSATQAAWHGLGLV